MSRTLSTRLFGPRILHVCISTVFVLAACNTPRQREPSRPQVLPPRTPASAHGMENPEHRPISEEVGGWFAAGRLASQCGSIDLRAFRGRYVHSDQPPSPRDAAIVIWDDRIRFGLQFARAELCPVRIRSDRDGTLELLALLHDDVDDPGDASITVMRLRRDGNTLLLSYGETEADHRRLHSLARVGEPVGGLDWWPEPAGLGLPDLPFGADPCDTSEPFPVDGRYVVDLESLPTLEDPFDAEVRLALIQSRLEPFDIVGGMIRAGRFGSRRLCLRNVVLDGSEAARARATVQGSDENFWIRGEWRGDSFRVQVARRSEDVADAPALPLRRVGEATEEDGKR